MPSQEQKKLVVHVITKTSSGYNNASGIVVAPGRVLTAGHVLEEAVSPPELRLCVLEPGGWIPAKTRWDGRDQGHDVAVLEFNPDTLAPASQEICKSRSHALINTGPWGSNVRWGSFGLPTFSWRTPKDQSKPIPEPKGLNGSTGSANPGGDLDLTSDGLPSDTSKWMGVSGSGVFIDQGLRAIIVEAVPQVPNMLRALWIKPLLDLQGFREAILWPPESKWTDHLAQEIRTLVAKPDMADLCERLGTDLALEGKDAATVAKALLDLPAFEFLLAADRVAHGLIGDGTEGQNDPAYEMARVLEKIVEVGLAGKLGTALLSRVVLSCRAGVGDGAIELPCMHIALAECYNAGLDGRRPGYREIPPDDRSGVEGMWRDLGREYPVWPEICVPLSPAVGFDEMQTAWPTTVLKHLALALKVPESQRSRLKTDADLAEVVNDKLETIAMAGQAVPKRWYLVCLDGHEPKVAQKLRDLLPQLRICVMRASEDREERKLVEQLATVMNQFLDRKRKRMNRR